MIKILFICHGNICRSPMAQYVLQNMVEERGIADSFYIDSAATSTEEIGNGVHYGTRRKLAEVGVPCGDHRAIQLTKKDYEEYDYLIGMDSANMRNINRMVGFDSEKKVYKLLDVTNSIRDIADPWYTGNFDQTYEDIVAGCKGLLEFLEKSRDFSE
ncbi:MAG: low molecular weight phosphotyrosine protein phosphatase [Eubacterium sp.]|nr:low molecular weight phosphotyrosine protein phosphatase [Eubacterium sp.]